MWSDELQKQTVEYFKTLPVAAMKHSTGKFGICTMENGKFVIQDRESEETYIFDSVEALVEDGWAID